MARVFTIPFNFRGNIYHAIVTTRTKKNRADFMIRINDVDLHEYIPGGQFEFDTRLDCKQQDLLQKEISRELIASIAHSVNEHLEKMDGVMEKSQTVRNS